MPGAWCSGGKWRRQSGSLSAMELIQRVANRYGKDKRQCATIANLLWDEVCVVLIEQGKVSLPGLRFDLRVKKIIGSEKRYGQRRQKFKVMLTPQGSLKARLGAMAEALNADDGFMDGVLSVPGEKTKNPFYPFKNEAQYIAYQERVAVLKDQVLAVDQQDSTPSDCGASDDQLVGCVADLDDSGT